MATAIRESVDITSLIKNILNSYPAGNPILRELLQNSDDAGAKEQVRIFIEPLVFFMLASVTNPVPSLDIYLGPSIPSDEVPP